MCCDKTGRKETSVWPTNNTFKEKKMTKVQWKLSQCSSTRNTSLEFRGVYNLLCEQRKLHWTCILHWQLHWMARSLLGCTLWLCCNIWAHNSGVEAWFDLCSKMDALNISMQIQRLRWLEHMSLMQKHASKNRLHPIYFHYKSKWGFSCWEICLVWVMCATTQAFSSTKMSNECLHTIMAPKRWINLFCCASFM